MPASFSVTPTDKAARRKLAPKAKKRKPAIVSERAAENTAKRVNATARRHDEAERVRGARNRADAAPAPKTLRQTAAVISLRDKKGTLKEKTARVAEAERSGAIPKHKGTKRPPLRSTGPTRATKRKEGILEELSGIAGLGGLGGVQGADIARAVAHTVGATAESVARDPVKQVVLAGKQAKDIAKGSAQLLALPYVASKEALHGEATTLKKMGKGAVDDISRRYGPAFRGDEGAYRKQVDRQRKEGSLFEAIDVVTSALPTVSVSGAAVRAAAKLPGAPAPVRAVARATRERAPKRVAAGVGRRAVKKGRVRPTAVGAAANIGIDAARKAVQNRRVKQAAAGKKPLTPRRMATQEGEVTPIFDRLADRRAKVEAVVDAGRRRTDAALTKRRELTNRKKSRGGTESLRATFDKLPAEKRTAALYALQLGIRDSESAEALLSQRAVDIQAERANEPPEIAAARRNDELPVIAELARNPAIFDDPEVRAAADAELARGDRMTGEGTAISPERAAAANAAPLGRTLGVERVESSAPSGDPIPKSEHRAIINAAKREHTKTERAARVAERDHARARATLARREGHMTGRVSKREERKRAGLRQSEGGVAGEKLRAATATVAAAKKSHRDALRALSVAERQHTAARATKSARADSSAERAHARARAALARREGHMTGRVSKREERKRAGLRQSEGGVAGEKLRAATATAASAKKDHRDNLRALSVAERQHTEARAEYARVKGRAEVLSRNVSGEGAERRAAADVVRADDNQFAAGGLGVKRAAVDLRLATRKLEAAQAASAISREAMASAQRRADALKGAKVAGREQGSVSEARAAEQAARAAAGAAKEADKAARMTAIRAARRKLEAAQAASAISREAMASAQRRADALKGAKVAGREQGNVSEARAVEQVKRADAADAREAAKATRAQLQEANRPKRSEPVLGETGAEFAARVREERKSVPGTTAEPGYYPSRYDAPQDVPLTASRAQLAGVGNRHREGVLYDQGRELKDPELLLRAHARNIDNYARQATRSDVLEREGIPYATREDAEKALADSGMAGKAIVVSADGAVLKGARTANIVDGRELPELDARADLGDFAPTTAHYIIPTTVQKELDALHKPISTGGRVLDRIQHLTQAAMLGLSPSWLQFQTIADTVALTAQGITPAQAIRATREYNALTDAGRQQVDVLVGGNPSSDLLRGSEDLGRTAAILASNPTYRKHFSGRKNPLTALLRADAQRTAGARRIALITKLERDAKTARIDKEIGDLRPLQRKLTRALGQQEPGELQRLLNDGDLAEQAAEHVAKIMGDFTSYTQAERAAMKRFIPFYGFLRYSLKLAFHTLPVDHPYVALLIAQVGQLTAEESRDIVGNEMPQGISRLYTNGGEKMVDFARSHPILNSIVAAETSNQLATAFMPPLAVIAANYAFKQNLWLGREYKVKGRTQGTKDLAGEERLRIVADELFKLIGLYKAAKELPNEPQGDDSLPWSRRPLRPTDTETIISTRETTAAREKQGGLKRAALKLFPLAAPEQPTQDRKIGEGKTRRKLEREQEKIDSEERRDYKLNDPLQQMKMEAEIQKMMRRQELGLPDAAAERKARRRELGLPPEVR